MGPAGRLAQPPDQGGQPQQGVARCARRYTEPVVFRDGHVFDLDFEDYH
jgi:hypothetical protein